MGRTACFLLLLGVLGLVYTPSYAQEDISEQRRKSDLEEKLYKDYGIHKMRLGDELKEKERIKKWDEAEREKVRKQKRAEKEKKFRRAKKALKKRKKKWEEFRKKVAQKREDTEWLKLIDEELERVDQDIRTGSRTSGRIPAANGDTQRINWRSGDSNRPSFGILGGYEDWTVMLRRQNVDNSFLEVDHTFKWIGADVTIPFWDNFRTTVNTSIAKSIMQGEFDHFRLGASPTFRLGVDTFYDCGVADAGFKYEYLYGPNFEREANGTVNKYMFEINRFTFESGITTNEHVRPFAAVRVTDFYGSYQPGTGNPILLDRYDNPVGGSVGVDLRTGPWESRMEMRFGDVEHGGLFKLKYSFKFD